MRRPQTGHVLCCLVLMPTLGAAQRLVLVEAESFANCGGWSNDQQFMDQMGSPFLLAHGLGVPVEDATTTVDCPAAGAYRVWVRTRDWVAPWKQPDTPDAKRAFGSPGLFQLRVNGKALDTTFGTEGADWHWQDGGVVKLTGETVALALHDLTGFEGRCDAVLLSAEVDYVPPAAPSAEWRRQLLGLPEAPEDAGEFDLVVVGGGSAGTSAALAAGLLGLRVALINDRPVLGGNSSEEVRVGYSGAGRLDPYPNLGNITSVVAWSRKPQAQTQQKAGEGLDALLAKSHVQVFLNCHVDRAATDAAGRIVSVTGRNIVTAKRLRFRGRWFADCTGDGNLGVLVGADYDLSYLHMGRTNLWRIARTDEDQPFPRCPWALDLTEKPFPGRGGQWACPDTRFDGLGGWYWESGFQHDPFEKGEYIRDWNLRAMYGAWDVLKNVDKDPRYEKCTIGWAAYISGKRESRRLLGDVVLTEHDLKSGKVYPDGIVPTSWRIDVHIPNHHFFGGFEGDAFIAIAPRPNSEYERPYLIPYRCLYSRNVDNLFLAGRDISVTHHALGAVRVQWTTGMMGELVGAAASLCKRYGSDPRGVYQNHLDELKALAYEGAGLKLPPQVYAYEPFDFTGTLSESGSGAAWRGPWHVKGAGADIVAQSLRYPAGLMRTTRGGSLRVSAGGLSAQRFLERPVELRGGRLFVTFLARRNPTGAFKLEFSDGEHIRLALAVDADGTVTPQGATVKASSAPGLFNPDTPYLVVLQFVNRTGREGAVASVRLFDCNTDTVPDTPRALKWDVATGGGLTGVAQDRLILTLASGTVQLDEVRVSDSWIGSLDRN